MKVQIIIMTISALLVGGAVKAQSQEPADSLAHELQEVVVTARQPATKLVGATLVSTITGSNLADLGNALDVLAQLPMIKVEDNAVSVIGKNNIDIFIDGRPMRDETELQQILSSNMKKVELDMAPGAAYGSTTGAVLRITTRPNFVEGLSLTDRFMLQKRRKWSVTDNLDLSYRCGNWEFFLNGTVNHNNSITEGTTVNTLVYQKKETVVGSSQRNSFPTTTGVIKGGVNYSQEAQSFGAYYRYNPEKGNFRNTGTEWLDDSDPINLLIDKRIRAHSHLASLYYDNIFAGKFRLHFDGDFRRSEEDSDVATTYPESTAADVNSADKRKSTLWAGKLYLDLPLWNGNLTIGTQDSHTHISLDYRMLNAKVAQYIPSSLTESEQTSAAVFASWSRTFGKFSLSAGTRYEYVDYNFNVDGKRDNDISRRDHTVTPDITIGYAFNDNANVSLS